MIQPITSLTILGLSEPVLTMIFDNLESSNRFPKIKIVNNLNIVPARAFKNPHFEIKVVETYEEAGAGPLFPGVSKVENKLKILAFFDFAEDIFVNIIHNNTAISSTASIGNGCLINSLVSIAGESMLGNFVTINRNSSIGHHAVIGDFVSINPGVNIAGLVNIGSAATIGIGSSIADGITIGKNSIIGAGSLVIKDIPENVIAYGVPCKIIKHLDDS